MEAIKALKAIGYLASERKDFLNPVQGPDLSWKQITACLLNQEVGRGTNSAVEELVESLDSRQTRHRESGGLETRHRRESDSRLGNR